MAGWVGLISFDGRDLGTLYCPNRVSLTSYLLSLLFMKVLTLKFSSRVILCGDLGALFCRNSTEA